MPRKNPIPIVASTSEMIQGKDGGLQAKKFTGDAMATTRIAGVKVSRNN